MGRVVEAQERTVVSEKIISVTCDFCGKKASASNDKHAAMWEEEIQVPDYSNDTGYDYEIIRHITSCYLKNNDDEFEVDIIVCPACFRKLFITKANNNDLNTAAVRYDLAKVRDAIINMNQLAQRIEAELAAFEKLLDNTRDFGISKLKRLALKVHNTLDNAESALLHTNLFTEDEK